MSPFRPRNLEFRAAASTAALSHPGPCAPHLLTGSLGGKCESGGNYDQAFDEKFCDVDCGIYRVKRTGRCSGMGAGTMHGGLTVPRSFAPVLYEMQ